MLSLNQWWPILMMIVMIVLTANSMMSMKTWWLGIDLRITRVRFPQITGALNFLQCSVLSTVQLIVTQRTAGSIPVHVQQYTSVLVYILQCKSTPVWLLSSPKQEHSRVGVETQCTKTKRGAFHATHMTCTWFTTELQNNTMQQMIQLIQL